MIYSSDGRIFRRKAGFSDDLFELVAPESDTNESLVDLIGSQIGYYSETEEKTLDEDCQHV